MTTQSGSDVREVIFITEGVSNDYAGLPADLKETADARMTMIQNGERLPKSHVAELTQGKLNGISEIRLPFDSNTYRVYFVLAYEEVVYVLDAGIKRSMADGEIPRPQVRTLVKRKQAAAEHYAANAARLKERAADRAFNRSRRADAAKTTTITQPRTRT